MSCPVRFDIRAKTSERDSLSYISISKFSPRENHLPVTGLAREAARNARRALHPLNKAIVWVATSPSPRLLDVSGRGTKKARREKHKQSRGRRPNAQHPTPVSRLAAPSRRIQRRRRNVGCLLAQTRDVTDRTCEVSRKCGAVRCVGRHDRYISFSLLAAPSLGHAWHGRCFYIASQSCG